MGGRRIIGDIGGTNARFAIAEGGKYRELMHVEVGRFGSLHDALTEYLNGLPPALRSELDGALAARGPGARRQGGAHEPGLVIFNPRTASKPWTGLAEGRQ